MNATLAALLYILLSHLALGALVYYYREKSLRAEEALRVMKEIGTQWRVSNAQLAQRAERAERALAERHEKEAADDAVVQERAAGDADLAVDLLRGLHEGGSSGGAGADGNVQPGADPGVPIPADGRKVQRR